MLKRVDVQGELKTIFLDSISETKRLAQTGTLFLTSKCRRFVVNYQNIIGQ